MSVLRDPLRVVAFACLTALAACTSTSPPTRPLILIGLDGLEWNVVLEEVSQGHLPALAELMRSGTYGRLRTFRPTLSPVVWTSIATGTTARRHGIRGFIKPAGDADHPRRLYRSSDRREKALWNILSEAGRRVDVVGWWNTYPAEAVTGVMVAQVNTTTLKQKVLGQGIWKGTLVQGLDRQVYPESRQDEILAIMREVDAGMKGIERDIFGDLEGGLGALERKLWEQSRWSFRADAVYAAVALRLAAEARSDGTDLLAVYFGGADVTGHRFWRYMFPDLYDHPPAQDQRDLLEGVVRAYYRYLDGVVAKILEAGPPVANVIVVSDHGMRPENTRAPFRAGDPANKVISGAHRRAPPAVFIASGPDIAPMEGAAGPPVAPEGLVEIGGVFDVAPTVLALLGMPASRNFDGDVLSNVLAEDFVRGHPVSYVDAYTEPDWHREVEETQEDRNFEQRIRQLRALGYLH